MNQPYNLTIKQLLVQMSHVGTSFTIVKLVLSNYSTTMTGGFCFCRWVWAGFLRRFLYISVVQHIISTRLQNSIRFYQI